MLKKAIIWGMGLSGTSALKLMLRDGYDLICVDKNPLDKLPNLLKIISENNVPEIKFYTEQQITLEIISNFNPELIMAAPGIDLRQGIWPAIKKLNYEIIGDVEYVARHIKTPIIAVTGTNGKSTTVNMIKQGLDLLGKKSFLGGNWGVPVSDVLLHKNATTNTANTANTAHDVRTEHEDWDYLIWEVSSFQLELTHQFAPMFAVILNITPSHMERYHSFDEYVRAKYKIFHEDSKQDAPQYAIYPESLEKLHKTASFKTNRSIRIFSLNDLKDFNFSKCHVLGDHNILNFAACFQVLKIIADQIGMSEKNFKLKFQTLIDSFRSIPHRLEFCGQKKSTYFYNDSKSTNIEATLTAVKSFHQLPENEKFYLILGGKLRGEDVSFLSRLRSEKKILQIFAIGEAGPKIEAVLGAEHNVLVFPHLDQAMKYIEQNILPLAAAKNHILFSPSFPSFDHYKNFEHRGDCFKKLVQDLG